MINIIAQQIFEEEQYQQHQLGACGMDKYGDRYRYVQNGGSSALVTGNLLQEAAEVTNFRSMNLATSQVIGDDELNIDLGGTAVTANQFDEGILFIESSTGIGQQFRIKRHETQSSTTGECKFFLDRPLKIAVTLDATQVTVRKNPYDGVVQYPVTTQTGGAAGVALYAMTVDYHGWVKSGGQTACLWDTGTNSANGASGVAPSAAVAGSVAPVLNAVGAITVGFSREVDSVDSTMGLVHLTID